MKLFSVVTTQKGPEMDRYDSHKPPCLQNSSEEIGGAVMAFLDFLSGADEAEDAIKKATKQAIGFQQQGQQRGGSGSSYPTPNLAYKNKYTGMLGGGV